MTVSPHFQSSGLRSRTTIDMYLLCLVCHRKVHKSYRRNIPPALEEMPVPHKPHTPCRYPGCPALCPGRYCPEHAREYERARGSSRARGYTREWEKVRRMYLRRHPICMAGDNGDGPPCDAPATEVHHLDGNTRNNSFDNLQALCKACHTRETWRRG